MPVERLALVGAAISPAKAAVTVSAAVMTLIALVVVPTAKAEPASVEKTSLAETYPSLYSHARQNQTPETDWWHDAKRGWFWFEKMPEDGERKLENLMETLDWTEIRKLPAPEMRKLLDELLDYAVSYPEPGNVQAYMTAQYLAKDRSVAFMYAWQDVIRDHPSLDETVKRPPSSLVSWQLEGARGKATETLISGLARDENVGLILFFSDECYFCSIQYPLFKQFTEETGWAPVEFVNVRERPDLAARFQIETIPEIWLAVKDKGFRRVTAGMRTLDVIRKNIIPAYEDLIGEKVIPEPYKLNLSPEEARDGFSSCGRVGEACLVSP
jgi:thiol-disulfide isomerase/thioredoxin